MKVSINTVRFLNKHYGSAGEPAPEGVDALVDKIGAQLGGVEETINFGERYKDVMIARIVSCRDHENSDHLHVCKLDDGGKTPNVERDENGHVQVVCGAPNVREGLLVAWLPPGATVPESLIKGEPFVLEARELRGEMSNGMLASPRELGIGDSHDGILEIVLDGDEQIAPGTRFAEAYHLDGDVIIDIENKMFTHRPDCFGLLGVAREIAGIQGQAYKSPAWYTPNADIDDAPESPSGLPLRVRNELPNLVPRLVAVVLQNVQVHESPLWMQLDLAKSGIRPINNIVDYTNWFMLETGQPLHAYDYDKLRALDSAVQDSSVATLVVRHPKSGEKILLLNGKEIEPRAEAIMIASEQKLIGVGGVMGGGETEVDEHTRNIVIECATFDMYSIRKTSMAHGLFTDAVTRFSKGQSPLQNRAVAAKIASEITRFAGGKIVGITDDNHVPAEVMARGSLHPAVKVAPSFINARLGLELSADDIAKLLENVEFKVTRMPAVSNEAADGAELAISAPFWRTDIEIREDIVEEVGRLYGFDHLPLTLPKRDLTPATQNPMLALKAKIRAQLAKAGANEVLTYSFVHGKLLDKAGQNRGQAFRLSNALSPDLQYYRLSLTPSLLDKVHANIKAGYDEFALFEMGKVHDVVGKDDEGLPSEPHRIALVYAANSKLANAERAGAPFYQARAFVENLLHGLRLHDFKLVEYINVSSEVGFMQSWQTPFAPHRAAIIMATVAGHENTVVGFVGEFKPGVRQKLKLPDYCAGFELDLDVLQTMQAERAAASDYTQLPSFPKIEQDICLKVSTNLPYQDLYEFAAAELEKIALPKSMHSLTPVDIFQREDDPEHKQITLRLKLASYEKTLRDEEVTKMLATLAAAAHEKFQAERV